jgi:flagellar basal body rod protein FlgG
MTPGIYSVVSAITARDKQQELLANNLSGSNAIGHKRELTSFNSFDQVLNQINGQGAGPQRLPVPLPYAQPTTYDLSSGEAKNTGQPLDAAIQGDGFFSVQTAKGVRLTRNGHFSLDSQRRLVNDGGMLVLGESGPITLSEGPVQIKTDGSIFVNNDQVANLKIVRPLETSLLQSDGGGSMFSFGSSKLDDVKNATLIPGSLENSNVDTSQEMMHMINNQRMHEMLTKVMQSQDENMGRAIQTMSEI